MPLKQAVATAQADQAGQVRRDGRGPHEARHRHDAERPDGPRQRCRCRTASARRSACVVFCQGDNVAKAKDAGADFAGGDDLIEKIQKENWLDFDVALATQDMMGQVSRGSVRCSAPAA